jgi:hypothetical protein
MGDSFPKLHKLKIQKSCRTRLEQQTNLTRQLVKFYKNTVESKQKSHASLTDLPKISLAKVSLGAPLPAQGVLCATGKITSTSGVRQRDAR